MGLDNLDKALEKAGLDPQGVRDLLVAEAVDRGLLQKSRTPTDEAVTVAGILVEQIDALLEANVDPLVIRAVLHRAIYYLEMKAAKALDDMFYAAITMDKG